MRRYVRIVEPSNKKIIIHPTVPYGTYFTYTVYGTVLYYVRKVLAGRQERSSSMVALLLHVKGLDAILMSIAVISACGAGCCLSLFLLFFQDMFSNAGSSLATGGAVDMLLVSRTCLSMVVIGGISASTTFVFYTCGTFVAARQKAAWKKAVMQAVLRQEIGWFDVSKTEELITMLGESVERIFKGLEGPTYMIFDAIGVV